MVTGVIGKSHPHAERELVKGWQLVAVLNCAVVIERIFVEATGVLQDVKFEVS